jgi:hypothetical protein
LPITTSFGPTFVHSTSQQHTHVQNWHAVESALQADTTAVLQALPRLTALVQILIVFVSQGCKVPSLKVRVLKQLLCSNSGGRLSVTTTSSAAQLPRFETVITYSTESPGQTSAGPHFSHVKRGFAQSKEQNLTGDAVAQKQAHNSPSQSHLSQTTAGRHSPLLIEPMYHVSLLPSTLASGSLRTKETPSGNVVFTTTSQTSSQALTSKLSGYCSPNMHIRGLRAVTVIPSRQRNSLLEGWQHFTIGLQTGSQVGAHAGAQAGAQGASHLGAQGASHLAGGHTGAQGASHLGAHG